MVVKNRSSDAMVAMDCWSHILLPWIKSGFVSDEWWKIPKQKAFSNDSTQYISLSGKYQKVPLQPGCPPGTEITTNQECKEAALSFGFGFGYGPSGPYNSVPNSVCLEFTPPGFHVGSLWFENLGLTDRKPSYRQVCRNCWILSPFFHSWCNKRKIEVFFRKVFWIWKKPWGVYKL